MAGSANYPQEEMDVVVATVGRLVNGLQAIRARAAFASGVLGAVYNLEHIRREDAERLEDELVFIWQRVNDVLDDHPAPPRRLVRKETHVG